MMTRPKDMLAGRSGTLTLLSLTLLITGGLSGVESVRMVEQGETVVVEDGTVDAVVLDCPYELEHGDRFDDLVIKWYHNNEPRPIYQWIPSTSESLPQADGNFVDVVDAGYIMEGEERPAHIHRALRLLNPTAALTGRYMCRVSSFNDDRTHMLDLVVYRKPGDVKVWTREVEVEVEVEQEQQGADRKTAKAVEVMCMVEDAFPQPSVSISHTLVDGGEKHQLKRVQKTVTSGQGWYRVEAEAQVFETDLEGLTEFHCQVTINKTDVDVRQHIKFQPSMEEKTGAVKSGDVRSKIVSATSVLLPLAQLAFFKWL